MHYKSELHNELRATTTFCTTCHSLGQQRNLLACIALFAIALKINRFLSVKVWKLYQDEVEVVT